MWFLSQMYLLLIYRSAMHLKLMPGASLQKIPCWQKAEVRAEKAKGKFPRTRLGCLRKERILCWPQINQPARSSPACHITKPMCSSECDRPQELVKRHMVHRWNVSFGDHVRRTHSPCLSDSVCSCHYLRITFWCFGLAFSFTKATLIFIQVASFASQGSFFAHKTRNDPKNFPRRGLVCVAVCLGTWAFLNRFLNNRLSVFVRCPYLFVWTVSLLQNRGPQTGTPLSLSLSLFSFSRAHILNKDRTVWDTLLMGSSLGFSNCTWQGLFLRPPLAAQNALGPPSIMQLKSLEHLSCLAWRVVGRNGRPRAKFQQAVLVGQDSFAAESIHDAMRNYFKGLDGFRLSVFPRNHGPLNNCRCLVH